MIQETATILESIVEIDEKGNDYYILNGSDNKVWLLPSADVRKGLEIYGASSLKGVLLKTFLPWIIKMSFIQKSLAIENVCLSLKQNVKEILDEISPEYLLSMYLGNTEYAQNRKVIIQVFNGCKIFGYAKFGLEQIVLDSFGREINTLLYLESNGIRGIPKVLWSGKIGQFGGFIQSTNRKGGEQTIYALEKEHWAFLKQIKDVTGKEIDFSSSSYRKIVRSFGTAVSETNWKCKDMLLECIENMERYYGEHKLAVSFYHGDFTPWNVCYKKSDLFVFDFEYAQKDFPIAMDAFHYMTQVGILAKSMSAEEIFQNVMNHAGQLSLFVKDIKFAYIQYLLYIIAFYYERMGEKLTEDEKSCRIWIRLIELCMEDDLKNERKNRL